MLVVWVGHGIPPSRIQSLHSCWRLLTRPYIITSPQHKIGAYIGFGIVAVFVIETLIAAFAMAGKDYRNILYAILVIVQAIILAILVFWYRQGDLDPKFIYLNVFLGFSVLLMCGVGQLYVFTEPVGYKCSSQVPPLMYYQPQDACLPYCEGQGMCLKFNPITCLNCSALAIAAEENGYRFETPPVLQYI